MPFSANQELNQDIDEDQSSYIAIDESDLLQLWLQKQKKGFMGVLRKTPSSKILSEGTVHKSLLAEIQAEAEYYINSVIDRSLPYSRAVRLNFYEDPYPVDFPQDFVDEVQEYPIIGTLEKKICFECSGSGEFTCGYCGGSGEVYCTTSGFDDDFGSSSSTETCTNCGGSGGIICSKCDGEGDLGFFFAERYDFIHWKKTQVFKEHANQLIDTDLPINDLPDDDARMIELSRDNILPNIEKKNIPKINKETIKALLRKKQEYKLMIENLDNVLFSRFTSREFPELKIFLREKKKEYILIGLGYKPLREKYMIADNYKLSKLRIFILFAFILILLVIICVLMIIYI
ncbi:MAG: hypothetical protein ACFFAO_04965 [Candidatus Hermodarchaeota archaeon]